MPRGSLPGERRGGRQKGTRNRASIAREAEIKGSGLTPLDYMLHVMRDERADALRRDEMAKAAAPYVHPRLAHTRVGGEGSGTQVINMVISETDMRL
jgi:hypothetical protein